MTDEPEGPAVPGGVDAGMGPFDQGLTDEPAYRGRTYRAAVTLGAVLLVVFILVAIVLALR